MKPSRNAPNKGTFGLPKGYADGGPAVPKEKKNPLKPHVPPRIVDPIPKSKHKLKRVPNKADGGPVREHGAPIGGTPAPGGSTRNRPRPGDRDPNFKKKKKRRPSTPSAPPAKPKPGSGGSTFRDYRGSEGVIDDASGVKKK